MKIAGTASALLGVSAITVPEDRMNITGQSSDLVDIINLKEYLPANVRLADKSFDGKITATVYIEPIATKDLSVPAENITISGVPEGMDVQFPRQAVLLEDQLEAVGEGGGRHRELRSLTAEQEVIGGQFSLVIGFGDVCTFLPVLPQKTFHLGGEVHIAVARAGLGLFYKDFLIRHLDGVAADVDGTLLPINVAPLQSAALAPPHSCGDDELEVGFVLDVLALQRGDDLLRRFLVRNLLFALAPGVAVGAPRRIMRKKATLHGIREDAAQRCVHALNGVLGEWLFRIGTDDFSQFCVEIPEVFRPQLGELVVTQRRENAFDVLPVAADGGLCQLAGRDVRQPQVDVFCQRELLDGLRRVAAVTFKEDGLLVEPLFDLLGCQFLRRVDGFLPGVDALAVVVIAHGDHDEIAAAALADACHKNDLSFIYPQYS